MSSFRRLPPVLRVASLLRLLFPLGLLAACVTGLTMSLSSSPPSGAYASRVIIIAANLGVVGLSCTLVVHAYNARFARFRQPGRGLFPLDTRQSQVRAIVLPAALSICALVLAVVIPPTAGAFEIVFPASILGAGVCLVFSPNERRVGSRGVTPPPQT